MGSKKGNRVIKSASIPVELARLMEENGISPSEAMRTGIIYCLKNRAVVVIDEELEKILKEKAMIKTGKTREIDEVVDEVPLYQLPTELKVKRIAKNIIERVKDTMIIEEYKVLETAAMNDIPFEMLKEELLSAGVQII